MARADRARLSHFGEKADPAQAPFRLIRTSFNKLVTFSNVGGAVEFASTPLVGLPKGDFIVVGGVLVLDVTEDPLSANISNTYNVTCSLGTTATADNALATTEINLLTAAAAGAAVASVSPHIKRAFDGINTLAGALAAAAGTFDNNAGSLAVFLNMTLPDADISGLATLRVKGNLRVLTCGLGKNA